MPTQESTPRFTVIIPTKNRAEYLRHTLRTCSLQQYEHLEVIVSDDGSTQNNREIVDEAARSDPRIRWLEHMPGVGMRDNFELALSEVKPGFVIALGGDDALLPDGIQGMHDALLDTGSQMLAWPPPIYIYPGVHGPNGQLVIYHRRDSKIIETSTFLARQAKHLNYLGDVESPMFYVKGVVSTELVNRVRSRSADGRFYQCPTPDGYSGIVLAGECPHYAFSAQPFSMHGVSADSQGLAHVSNGERALRSSEDFLRSVASRPMHQELASQPYSPLITLMTVDYLLTARDLPGWPGRIPPIDYRLVLVKALEELGHGLFGGERVRRELTILDAIAEQHGLRRFFRDRVASSTRSRIRAPFQGTGVNATAWFVDARAYALHNVFDAAYAAKYLYQAYADLQPAALGRHLAHSLRYRAAALGKGEAFPPVADWGAPTSGTV